MRPKAVLLRVMQGIAVLFALDGMIYCIALMLTPFKRNDLYVGPAAAYFAIAAFFGLLLIRAGLVVLVIAFLRRHVYRWRMVGMLLAGMLFLVMSYAVSVFWIRDQLKQKNPGSNAGVASTTGVFGAGTFKIQTPNRPGC